MYEIKHLLYESGVYEVFRLIVTDSQYSGVYDIEKPEGWDDMDSVLNINEEYFNVDEFIIGESNKIRFLQYVENSGFDVIRNVYEEKGGDGSIAFKWIAVKGTDEFDLLGDGFEINLNKYEEGFEQTMLYVETEIKKRESQSKLLNREDISVNLFSDKDLDNLPILPVTTDDIFFKESGREFSNFYFYSLTQVNFGSSDKYWFFLHTRGDDYEIGDNSNSQIGMALFENYKGALISTKILLPSLSIEVSNMDVAVTRENSTFPEMNLIAVKTNLGWTGNENLIIEKIHLKESSDFVHNGNNSGQIKIVNESFDVGSLKENQELHILFELVDKTSNATFIAIDTTSSVEVKANLSTPIRKSKTIRLYNALDQICKSATNGNITLESVALGLGGVYNNTSISTGAFLRNIAVENKMTTSFKDMFYDGVARLLALGFDLQDDKIVVEDIGYFFKDVQTMDLSAYEYSQNDLVISNDTEMSFNELLFGNDKYSTGSKGDLYNGITEFQATTPLKTVKRKFDKRASLILDEDKIQNIILEDNTTSRSSDDDLILIDLVNIDNLVDEGVLPDATHSDEGGYLNILSFKVPFDTLPLTVGGSLTIISGSNKGTYTINSINKARIVLNKTTSIESGTFDTAIRFTVGSVLKNRSDEGFLLTEGLKDSKTASNLRHNPKYQMARWFPFFGGSFDKKAHDEEIIITEYKNNGEITVAASDLSNEMQGSVTFGANESLLRLRDHRNPFFSSKKIQITICDVEFHTFIELYNKWRYGAVNRGYITVNTPIGIVDVYPFGSNAMMHNKMYNELTINGKIKYGSGLGIVKAILNDVDLIDSSSVSIEWTYLDYFAGNEVILQASKDGGISWDDVKVLERNQYVLAADDNYVLADEMDLPFEVEINDTDMITQTDVITGSYFETILNGTNLMFRIVVNTPTFRNIGSNVITKTWNHNIFIYKEVTRLEPKTCGKSQLIFTIEGGGTATINWDFTSMPSGGSAYIYDDITGALIRSFESVAMTDMDIHNATGQNVLPISGLKRLRVELSATNVVNNRFLTCFQIEESDIFIVTASLSFTITDGVSYNISKNLNVTQEMFDRKPEML